MWAIVVTFLALSGVLFWVFLGFVLFTIYIKD
jgi:hypothetical protein